MNPVIDYYNSFGDREWSRLDREPLEFTVNWYYINKYLPATGRVLDNGAGPGKYAIALAQQGYQMTLTDLTPKLVELAKEKSREHGVETMFDGFHVADARDLSEFVDQSFDASLMLGPMYHLQNEIDRRIAVQELRRVTKCGSYVFVAFRSRTNHALASLRSPGQWKPNDNMNAIQEFMNDGIFNHSDEGRYTGAYFFNVEDINPFMESSGFQSINLIGSTNIGTLLSEEQLSYWKEKGHEEYAQLVDFLIQRAQDPSLLGISSHLLYIGRKV
ncbi:class I SAM-dependent methyltransferase [Paenibacillus glacialis]|uniref:Methyltransferase n=1 Tax=Paenibacillus glacialis TaxID=494026 RepID=A0A168MEX9_9BACL|nr:class I SAM-dependent methyltransferase [Paenibacillus glacialis]OAB44598.1 methyltransferase [Paenibacillus glacialis]